MVPVDWKLIKSVFRMLDYFWENSRRYMNLPITNNNYTTNHSKNFVDNGRKINAWSTNKYSNELHTAVSEAFSVPSSVQSKSKTVKKCSYL